MVLSLKNKRKIFESSNVFKSIGKLKKSPKGYDKYVVSKRPFTHRYGGRYYKVRPYYTDERYNSLTRKHERVSIPAGFEYIKNKPKKRVYVLR